MISQKARPTALGATYNRGIGVRQLNAKPDAAPSGAKRVLFARGYKDVAPTELVAASRNVQPPEQAKARSQQTRSRSSGFEK